MDADTVGGEAVPLSVSVEEAELSLCQAFQVPRESMDTEFLNRKKRELEVKKSVMVVDSDRLKRFRDLEAEVGCSWSSSSPQCLPCRVDQRSAGER